MRRSEAIAEVEARLGRRRLVWFGTRGDDVESLGDLRQFSAAFSIIGRYDRRNVVHALSMEDLTGVRVDLDTYDIDDEPDREAFRRFRAEALRVLSEPSVVVTYRPSALVSSLSFARSDRCTYLGMFKDHQAAFEHKPWVESALRRLVPSIGWDYIADEEQLTSLRLLDRGPIVLRRSRSSGGVGFAVVDSEADLAGLWPEEDDGYVSVAPLVPDGIPVNVGAVVWREGEVTLHPASVQLIGVPTCTRRPFGYCGNDFGAVRDLGDEALARIGDSATEIGRWLANHGYIGAFGVDFLVTGDVPLFLEVNPRFQGSTHLSAQISVEADRPCILLDHIAACMGVRSWGTTTLTEHGRDVDLAHLVVHRTTDVPGHMDGVAVERTLRRRLPILRGDVCVDPGLVTNPDATVVRLTTRTRLTGTGFEIPAAWADAIADLSDEHDGPAHDAAQPWITEQAAEVTG